MTHGQRPALGYGDSPRAKLDADDVNGGPAILTIKSASRRNMARRGQGEDYKVVLVFADQFEPKQARSAEPSPEREHVCNATDYKTLAEQLSNDDEETWRGKRVVMVLGSTQYEGKTFEKMMVATPERWVKVMDAARKAAEKAKGATKDGGK